MDYTLGPFHQIVTMENLPDGGPVRDEQLRIISNGGVHIKNGAIAEIGPLASMRKVEHVEITQPCVLIPGLIDAHTHICYAGTRARDYALRLTGQTYQEIAASGGGILYTVKETRKASKEELLRLLIERLKQQFNWGITTCEIKSGYGLNIDDEIKILQVIKQARGLQPVDLVATCLAAHMVPPEFDSPTDYLNKLNDQLLPILLAEHLAKRIDIFVEEGAFSPTEARPFLESARKQGFALALHADQFTLGGSGLAAEVKAQSADHLEQTTEVEIAQLKDCGVHPVILPGASLGLGLPFAPARKLLDGGLPLAIASDWNPGSAPMGNLLAQAAILGAAEHLSMAETLAALTVRAGAALGLKDRGSLVPGKRGDMIGYSTKDYREILYYQGSMTPSLLVSAGQIFYSQK